MAIQGHLPTPPSLAQASPAHPTPPEPMDGWRTMRRVDGRVRRPGARASGEDHYLKSLFPDTNFASRCTLLERLKDLEGWQNWLEKQMLSHADRIAAGLRPRYNYELINRNRERQWGNWEDHGRDAALVADFNRRENERKELMLAWTSRKEMRWAPRMYPGEPPELPETIPPWVECQFEREARRYDRGHKPLLAARRRLARVLLRRHLRRAVLTRAIALYWQEQTQRALCAPGGAGRAADMVAFESEFA